jgi:hypothetical protein
VLPHAVDDSWFKIVKEIEVQNWKLQQNEVPQDARDNTTALATEIRRMKIQPYTVYLLIEIVKSLIDFGISCSPAFKIVILANRQDMEYHPP